MPVLSKFNIKLPTFGGDSLFPVMSYRLILGMIVLVTPIKIILKDTPDFLVYANFYIVFATTESNSPNGWDCQFAYSKVLVPVGGTFCPRGWEKWR